jgi:hypothetical protein
MIMAGKTPGRGAEISSRHKRLYRQQTGISTSTFSQKHRELVEG